VQEAFFKKIEKELRGYIKDLAGKFSRDFSSMASREDFEQAALIGLWRAKDNMTTSVYRQVVKFAMNDLRKNLWRAARKIKAYAVWWNRAFRGDF
jgi:DNA-directed RNA polymerase specialized sigma subunit